VAEGRERLHATTRVLRRLVTLAAGGRLGGSRLRPVAGSIFLVRIRNSHNSHEDIGLGTIIREVWVGSGRIDNGTGARRPALEKYPASPIPPSPPCLAGLNSGAAPRERAAPDFFPTVVGEFLFEGSTARLVGGLFSCAFSAFGQFAPLARKLFEIFLFLTIRESFGLPFALLGHSFVMLDSTVTH
jgi:hypothetical protein